MIGKGYNSLLYLRIMFISLGIQRVAEDYLFSGVVGRDNGVRNMSHLSTTVTGLPPLPVVVQYLSSNSLSLHYIKHHTYTRFPSKYEYFHKFIKPLYVHYLLGIKVQRILAVKIHIVQILVSN